MSSDKPPATPTVVKKSSTDSVSSNPSPGSPQQDTRVQVRGWTATRRPQVLVVEDDVLMREMLTETLEAIGCVVTQASNVLPWMTYCAENAAGNAEKYFDLVVSDIRMPGISGLGLLENVSQTHLLPPTILITAYGDAQTHEHARRAGAVTVLDKPFSIQTFLSWVDHVLGGAD